MILKEGINPDPTLINALMIGQEIVCFSYISVTCEQSFATSQQQAPKKHISLILLKEKKDKQAFLSTLYCNHKKKYSKTIDRKSIFVVSKFFITL